MLRSLSKLALLALLTGLGANCSSKDTSANGSGANGSGANGSGANGSGANGSGANGSGGSGQTYVPPTCGQPCQDYLVGWALDDTVWFLWNQKVAGHPVGVQDIMGPCPLGGSVHFTGMDGVAGGTTTTAIQVLLDACENANEQYDLTFTGTVSMDGSFNSDTSFGAEVFSAPGLDVTGTLSWLDDPPIEQGCDVTVSQRGVGKSSTLSGRVCGRDIDKSELDPASSSGGGSGQGGSSATAGSTGSDCSCFCPDGRDCTDAQIANPCGVDTDGIPNACACPVDCK
jgi:hypothetical protein